MASGRSFERGVRCRRLPNGRPPGRLRGGERTGGRGASGRGSRLGFKAASHQAARGSEPQVAVGAPEIRGGGLRSPVPVARRAAPPRNRRSRRIGRAPRMGRRRQPAIAPKPPTEPLRSTAAAAGVTTGSSCASTPWTTTSATSCRPRTWRSSTPASDPGPDRLGVPNAPVARSVASAAPPAEGPLPGPGRP